MVARPYERRPVRYEYALTADGAELAGAIRALAGWGARWGGGGEAAARHAVCGTRVELRFWCPSCREPVAEGSDSSREEVKL